MPVATRRLVVILPCTFFVLLLIVFYRPYERERIYVPKTAQPHWEHRSFDGSWDYRRDGDNLLLTQGQCDQAFPGLFADIERASADRGSKPITLKELDSITPRNGYIRAMIYDQQLYVISKEGGIWSREIATLSAMHRAVITSPEPLPNIEFAFNTDDSVDPVALWGYARRQDDKAIWLMPDFGYWSWPEPKIGSAKEVQAKIEWDEEQEGLTWRKKTPKLLWRGASNMGPGIRDKLMEVSAGRPWADVRALTWSDPESKAHDYKSMPQHCEYKYVAQTEGNTYSGRLKYLQICRSVVVSHKLDWTQHHYHLMKPSGPDQNFIEVERDWSNLEEKMQWLISHDDDAKRIADNNVKAFRERYLTPAAEVCYWRRLFREWSKASNFDPPFFERVNGKKEWRGLPVETFLMMRERDWEMS